MAKTLEQGRKAGSGRKPGSVSFIQLTGAQLSSFQTVTVSRLWAEQNGLHSADLKPASEIHTILPKVEVSIIDLSKDSDV